MTQISFLDCPGCFFFIKRRHLNVCKSKRGFGAPAVKFLTLLKNFQYDIYEKTPVSRCCLFEYLINKKALCSSIWAERDKANAKRKNVFYRFLKWFDNWVLKFFCFPCHTVTFGAWHNGIQPQIFKIIYHNSEIMFFERPIIIPVRYT